MPPLRPRLPHVAVCLTAPSNRAQLNANLAAVQAGALNADDMTFMHTFGDAVHQSAGWFW